MSTTILKKKLDTIFSIYIRLKYADEDLNVQCFTCDRIYPYKKMQNAHFWGRTHLSTRWDEENCYPGCYGCNVAKNGNYIEYTLRLQKHLGEQAFEALEQRKNQTFKPTKDWYLDKIDEYTVKVANL